MMESISSELAENLSGLTLNGQWMILNENKLASEGIDNETGELNHISIHDQVDENSHPTSQHGEVSTDILETNGTSLLNSDEDDQGLYANGLQRKAALRNKNKSRKKRTTQGQPSNEKPLHSGGLPATVPMTSIGSVLNSKLPLMADPSGMNMGMGMNMNMNNMNMGMNMGMPVPTMMPNMQQSFSGMNLLRTGMRRREGRRELFPAGTYKTEICRSFMNAGFCEYGDNCQFAHGLLELRPRHFDVKYKTQLCKNYHKDGQCRFGARCKFIHDEHRIQVSENEFWLVSPSENLVRVEVVDNVIRRQQLLALVESPPPPPPCATEEDRKRQEIHRQRIAHARLVASQLPALQASLNQYKPASFHLDSPTTNVPDMYQSVSMPYIPVSSAMQTNHPYYSPNPHHGLVSSHAHMQNAPNFTTRVAPPPNMIPSYDGYLPPHVQIPASGPLLNPHATHFSPLTNPTNSMIPKQLPMHLNPPISPGAPDN